MIDARIHCPLCGQLAWTTIVNGVALVACPCVPPDEFVVGPQLVTLGGRTFALTAEQVAAAEEKPGQYIGIADLLDAGNEPKHRGAFRALAEIGLAIAYGMAVERAAELKAVFAGEGCYRAAAEVDKFLLAVCPPSRGVLP